MSSLPLLSAQTICRAARRPKPTAPRHLGACVRRRCQLISALPHEVDKARSPLTAPEDRTVVLCMHGRSPQNAGKACAALRQLGTGRIAQRGSALLWHRPAAPTLFMAIWAAIPHAPTKQALRLGAVLLSQPGTRGTRGLLMGCHPSPIRNKRLLLGADSPVNPNACCRGTNARPCVWRAADVSTPASRQLPHDAAEAAGGTRKGLHSALERRGRWPVKASRRVQRRSPGRGQRQRCRCELVLRDIWRDLVEGAISPVPTTCQKRRDWRRVRTHGCPVDTFDRPHGCVASPGSRLRGQFPAHKLVCNRRSSSDRRQMHPTSLRLLTSCVLCGGQVERQGQPRCAEVALHCGHRVIRSVRLRRGVHERREQRREQRSQQRRHHDDAEGSGGGADGAGGHRQGPAGGRSCAGVDKHEGSRTPRAWRGFLK